MGAIGLLFALDGLQKCLDDYDVVDRGHKHSSGASEAWENGTRYAMHSSRPQCCQERHLKMPFPLGAEFLYTNMAVVRSTPL